jgi:hypothetical protein
LWSEAAPITAWSPQYHPLRKSLERTVKFEEIRLANDEKLGHRHDALRRGADADSLAFFAKAYLGIFAKTGDCDHPRGRVRLLASDALADAVLAGFVAALRREDLPSPQAIGEATARDEPQPIGFVVLAGMDCLGADAAAATAKLPEATLRCALCFHYVLSTGFANLWVGCLLEQRPQVAASALEQLWLGMVGKGTDYLPALGSVLEDPRMRPILRRVVLPLLRGWTGCGRGELRRLLLAALGHADREALLEVCRQSIGRGEQTDVVKRVYWLTTAFLLAPVEFESMLSAYVARSSERALRLLDFVVTAATAPSGTPFELSPATLGPLLLLIGPKFPPQGDFDGVLDEIDQKVVWLFDALGRDGSEAAGRELRRLRRVRVMRSCNRVLDRAEALRAAGAPGDIAALDVPGRLS